MAFTALHLNILLALAGGFLLLNSANGIGLCENPLNCCDNAATPESKGIPGNCTAFYLCINRAPRLYHCSNPDKPFYNVLHPGCDTPTSVPDCAAVGPTEPPITNPNANCTEPGGYLIPYPGDCSRFMICANYELMPNPGQCESGTLFDPVEFRCKAEEEVSCAPECPATGIVLFPDSKACDGFWICEDGAPFHANCDPDFFFDPFELVCVDSGQVFCPNDCPLTGTDTFPHSGTNCTWYWLCAMGVPYLQTCADGLIYDDTVKGCVIGSCPRAEINAECLGKGSSSVRKPASCREYFVCENDRIIGTGTCKDSEWFFQDAAGMGPVHGECREPSQADVC